MAYQKVGVLIKAGSSVQLFGAERLAFDGTANKRPSEKQKFIYRFK